MSALPVLMYHHVTPQPGLVTVSPQTFRSHMAWLASHGYRGVGTEALADFLAGRPLPPKSVVITFDDGYLDNYVYAHPVLAEFGLKAVLFLVTGWLGEGPVRPCLGQGRPLPETPNHRQCMDRVSAGASDEVMLRWSEVAHMAAAGTFEFHSHTHTHTRWDKLENDPMVRRQRLGQDLQQSREALVNHLGQCSSHLCWPQGYYDDAYVQVA
ncbi:MAG: polysaccharide deacetylase family protein, partial [Betaproteobacteria bacterium]|nr:polysaccharide deacetylase family protein [Betaproteobacteria bacterium]